MDTTNKQNNQPGLTTVAIEDGAEIFVEMLISNDVDYLFINSGTDTFPIQEAIGRRIEDNRPVPEVILCIDELTAMFAAQGYFQLTGKPQVVLVHVDSGTAQIGAAYHDLQRDRSGVVLCAGRAPATIGDEMAGGKDFDFHWTQEQPDQASIARTYIKYEYNLNNIQSMNWVMQKAFQIAASEPAGIVYLTLPRELLMEKTESARIPPSARHTKPLPPTVDAATLMTIADWLIAAERPLIMTGSLGRHPQAVAALTELAELCGAPVQGALGTRLNFPSHHPLNALSCNAPTVAEADLILVFDSDIPWVPDRDTLEPDAKIVWVDMDPTKDTIPMWSFPADLLIQAASRKVIPELTELVRNRLSADAQTRIASRVQAYTADSAAFREQLQKQAIASAVEDPISPLWVAHCLQQVLDDDTILLNEAISGDLELNQYIDRASPATYFRSGGSSLGWAPGAAFGARLAEPEKTVICIVGDGTFVFSRPTSVLWAAEKYQAAFLTIIYNNSRHYATRRHWERWYPDGVAVRSGNFVGVDISPSPEYHLLAQASRAYGEKVEKPDEVLPALTRALERVRDGQAAVLDIRM